MMCCVVLSNVTDGKSSLIICCSYSWIHRAGDSDMVACNNIYDSGFSLD